MNTRRHRHENRGVSAAGSKAQRPRPRGWHRLILATLLAGSSAVAARGEILPRDLLIYYSWPSLINGSNGNIALAAAEFSRYDDIILGDLIETPEHPDHANTVAILTESVLDETRVFGYIDLGVSPGQNLSLAEIENRMQQWQATGADGIFLDDFGYDYSVTRERQNAATELAHGLGMSVIANAWIPAHALGDEVDPVANPSGTPTALNSSDFYLFESFQIQEGSFVSEAAWQAKAEALKVYRNGIGIGVFTVTTELSTDEYEESKFHYSWFSGLLYSYDSVGWGDYLFSALDALAPFRDRPVTSPGSIYLGEVVDWSPEYWRYSDMGRVFVDASTHTFGFEPGTTAIEAAEAPGASTWRPGRLRTFPNPTTRGTTIHIEADRGSQSSLRTSGTRKRELLLVDALGRIRATTELAPGAGRLWNWTPPDGLASGHYTLVLLDAGTPIATGELTRVR